MPDPSLLGAEIHRRRVAASLSLRRLTEITGLAWGTIGRLESGAQQSTDVESITRIAKALGCTAAELLGEAPPAAEDTGEVRLIPLGWLIPSPLNPRTRFPESTIDELADSIAADGLLQPLMVRPGVCGDDGKPSLYEVIVGGRRLRALRRLHTQFRWPHAHLPDEKVPCTVREMPDREALVIATAENVQREDMHPLEEGDAILAMERHGVSIAEAARELGKHPRWAQERARTARDLVPDARDACLDGRLSYDRARALSRATPEEQRRHLPQVLAGDHRNAAAIAGAVAATTPPKAPPRRPADPGTTATADALRASLPPKAAARMADPVASIGTPRRAYANRVRTALLQSAVATDHRAALALLAMALMGAGDILAVRSERVAPADRVQAETVTGGLMYWRDTLGGNSPFAPLAAETQALRVAYHLDRDADAQRGLFDRLLMLDGDRMASLLADLVAARIRSGDPLAVGCEPLALAVAERAGLDAEMSHRWQPDPAYLALLTPAELHALARRIGAFDPACDAPLDEADFIAAPADERRATLTLWLSTNPTSHVPPELRFIARPAAEAALRAEAEEIAPT